MTCANSLVAAIESADPALRLCHLVAAWRSKRAAAIAELIVALGAQLDRTRGTLPGKDNDARMVAWLAVEKTRTDDQTGWLLASPPLQDTRTEHYRPRLQRVATWQPDPRLGEAMMVLIEENSFGLHDELWKPVFAQLIACGDKTLVPRLLVERERLVAAEFFTTRIDRAVAALRKVSPPKLTAKEAALVEQLKALRPRGEAELLAAIWRAPDDDGPRLVYADYLQEAGDPRGEFIALQCAAKLDAAGRKRMKALAVKHRAKWFGPLEPAILEQKPFTFERGFLATCHVCAMWGMNPDDVSDSRERAIRALQDHPAWSTLTSVKLTKIATRTRAPLLAHLAKLGVEVAFVKS